MKTIDIVNGLFEYALNNNDGDLFDLAMYACSSGNLTLLTYLVNEKNLDPFYNNESLLIEASTGSEKIEIIKYLLGLGLTVENNKIEILKKAARGSHDYFNGPTNLSFYLGIGTKFKDIDLLTEACIYTSLVNFKTLSSMQKYDGFMDVMFLEMLRKEHKNDFSTLRYELFKYIWNNRSLRIKHIDKIISRLIEYDMINEFEFIMTDKIIDEHITLLKHAKNVYPNSKKIMNFLNEKLTRKNIFIRKFINIFP